MAQDTLEGIELLRRVVQWADWQREDHWLPEDGPAPTLTQIVLLHSLCLSWDVETPEDLANHENPRARSAWKVWHGARGNSITITRETIPRKTDQVVVLNPTEREIAESPVKR